MIHFPVTELMVSKTKVDNRTSPTGNMMLIAISYQIILIVEESVLLGVFKLGDEVLDVFGMDNKFL